MRFFEKMNRANLFALVIALFCGVFYACSSTSSSSSDADEEELPKNNGGTDSLSKADSLKLDRFNVAAEGEVLAKDGQKYKTLTVGSVTWMVENMKPKNRCLPRALATITPKAAILMADSIWKTITAMLKKFARKDLRCLLLPLGRT